MNQKVPLWQNLTDRRSAILGSSISVGSVSGVIVSEFVIGSRVGTAMMAATIGLARGVIVKRLRPAGVLALLCVVFYTILMFYFLIFIATSAGIAGYGHKVPQALAV